MKYETDKDVLIAYENEIVTVERLSSLSVSTYHLSLLPFLDWLEASHKKLQDVVLQDVVYYFVWRKASLQLDELTIASNMPPKKKYAENQLKSRKSPSASAIIIKTAGIINKHFKTKDAVLSILLLHIAFSIYHNPPYTYFFL